MRFRPGVAYFARCTRRSLVAYFLFNMMVLSVAVVSTAFVLRVHRMGRRGAEPPPWALRLFALAPGWKQPGAPLFLADLDGHHRCDEVWAREETPLRTVDQLQRRVQAAERTLRGRPDERNGFVRLAERLDWVLMVLFLVLLTLPVIYLWFYL